MLFILFLSIFASLVLLNLFIKLNNTTLTHFVHVHLYTILYMFAYLFIEND